MTGRTPDIAALVRHYQANHPGGYLDDRRSDRPYLAAALTERSLREPDRAHLRKLVGFAYGSPGPQPGFSTLLNTPEGGLRAARTLGYLLYGPGDDAQLARRLDECIAPHGAYKLPRVGEAIMVKALAVTYPDRWIPCFVADGTPDKLTRRKKGKWTILRLLGVRERPGLSPGNTAVVTNDLIKEVLADHLPSDDPWGMQDFTWWLLNQKDNIDANA